eukprot:2969318-Amphidinium_carterae.1
MQNPYQAWFVKLQHSVGSVAASTGVTATESHGTPLENHASRFEFTSNFFESRTFLVNENLFLGLFTDARLVGDWRVAFSGPCYSLKEVLDEFEADAPDRKRAKTEKDRSNTRQPSSSSSVRPHYPWMSALIDDVTLEATATSEAVARADPTHRPEHERTDEDWEE